MDTDTDCCKGEVKMGEEDYRGCKESVVRAPKKIDGVSISTITREGKKSELISDQAREAAEACSVSQQSSGSRMMLT